MSRLQDIELTRLGQEEIPLAAAVAARGMRDNPISVALFGDDPVRRARALKPMFEWVLIALERPSLVARRQGHIVGVAALSPPDRCFYRQMTAREKTVQVGRRRLGVTAPPVPVRLLLPLLRLGPGALARVSTWGDAGLKHDPWERHQHVELVAVEAALQGLGVGTLMMEELCREMDEVGDLSYLETDKRENVRFYERFGFEVSGEATVLGTHNWYMQRRSPQDE